MTIQQTIRLIEKSLKKVKLPWYGTSNYPFYVDIRKPRESLSKHDYKMPSYWQHDDGEYLLFCVNEMPKILEYIKDLEARIKRMREAQLNLLERFAKLERENE